MPGTAVGRMTCTSVRTGPAPLPLDHQLVQDLDFAGSLDWYGML
jgi:hypothetical protein